MPSHRMVVTALATVLAALLAVSDPDIDPTSSPLNALPNDLLERILMRVVEDGGSLKDPAQVCRRFRQLCGLTPAMTKLFHEPFSDAELPALIDQMADDIRSNMILKSFVTVQTAAGLFDRLMQSKDLDPDVKIGALRVLITKVNEELFLDLALSDATAIGDPSIQELFLNGKKPLHIPADLIGVIPDHLFAKLHSVQNPPRMTKPNWDDAFLKNVQSLFPPRLQHIFPDVQNITANLSFCWLRGKSDLLGNEGLVKLLFKCGVRPPIWYWVDRPDLFDAKLIPVLTPLLSSSSARNLINSMLNYAAQGAFDHAAAILQIPRVRQILRSQPAILIGAVIDWDARGKVYRIPKDERTQGIRKFLKERTLIKDVINSFHGRGPAAIEFLIQLASKRAWNNRCSRYHLILNLMGPHIPDFQHHLHRMLDKYSKGVPENMAIHSLDRKILPSPCDDVVAAGSAGSSTAAVPAESSFSEERSMSTAWLQR